MNDWCEGCGNLAEPWSFMVVNGVMNVEWACRTCGRTWLEKAPKDSFVTVYDNPDISPTFHPGEET